MLQRKRPVELYNLVSFAGLFLLLAIGWLFSTNRRAISPRLVIGGMLLQLLIGFFVFVVPFGSRLFLFLSDGINRLMGAAFAGTSFLFGPLAIPPGQPGSIGFILALQALPTIIFFASLMGFLYYVGVMPILVKWFGRIFTKFLGTSGAESLCTASNIFVGIEANTTILPFLKKMTRSELCTILTGGMATIASSMMGVYVMVLQTHFPHIAAHLISASLISAPASLLMSKMLLPETGEPETRGLHLQAHYEKESSLMEALIRGAMAGGKLVFGIAVLLAAFLGLVALANLILGGVGLAHLEELLAYPFYPLTLLIGVPPTDAWEVARLLSQRIIVSEVPAYQQLATLLANHSLQEGRSAVLAAYALCGFAHIASVAIFVGGTAALIPERTKDLAQVAWRALAAATLACLMTAAIAGTFYGQGILLLK